MERSIPIEDEAAEWLQRKKRKLLKDLAATAVTAACKHFSSLAMREEWLSVPSALAHKLLSDNRLRVQSEDEV